MYVCIKAIRRSGPYRFDGPHYPRAIFSQGPSTTVLDYFSLKICSDMFVFWRNFPCTRWNTILSSNLFLSFLLVANSWKLNAEFMVGSEECMIALTFMHCCILKMSSVYFLFRQTNWLSHARFYIPSGMSLIKTMFSNIYMIVGFLHDYYFRYDLHVGFGCC